MNTRLFLEPPMLCPTQIRLASEDDADGLAKFRSDTLRDAYAGAMPADFVDPVREPEHASRIRTAIHDGTRTWLLAIAADELVGACALAAARDCDVPADVGEIIAIAVVSQHRRHGHGIELLNAVHSVARDRSWRELVLWVVAGHAQARAFYAYAGFTADGGEMVNDHLGFSVSLLRYRRSVIAAPPLASASRHDI